MTPGFSDESDCDELLDSALNAMSETVPAAAVEPKPEAPAQTPEEVKQTLIALCDKCVSEGRVDLMTQAIDWVNENMEKEAPAKEAEAAAPEVFYREYEYMWTMENYSKIRYLPRGLGFLAPFFKTMSGTEGAPDAQWSWGVLPTNINTGKEGYMALFCRLRNFDEFTAKDLKVVGKCSWRLWDKDMNLVKACQYRGGRDITDWTTRDGANAYNFIPLEQVDELLADGDDKLTVSLTIEIRVDHELSELEKDKKLIEYTTQPSVEKFCYQHRITDYFETEKSEVYHIAAQIPQQLPTGKVALWEATYRRNEKGHFGAKLKLVNGDQFKSCEVVSGSHFMIMNRDGTTASQAGQRMRDDWNLSTAEGGWGRSNIIADDEIEQNRDVVLDESGALIVNYTLFLNTSTHSRKQGNTGLGNVSLDGGKTSSAKNKSKQIMLSYNWGTKETVQKIKAKLEEWGYKTWIDDNQMGDNIMLSMAEGVFNSDAVMVCLTDNYQNSFNCQKEASMTYDERKPMIPLKLEADVDWKPWVKLLISGKRYIEVANKPFDDFCEELKAYLERMDNM